MNTNMHTNFGRDVSNSVSVIAYIILKRVKVPSENVAMATIFARIFKKLQRSDVGPSFIKEL